MMTKHVFNAQALRDSASLKPNYKDLIAYLNSGEEVLDASELQQLKSIIKAQTKAMIERIDTSIQLTKSKI